MYIFPFRCLWFFLEPIVVKGENYGFLGKLLDTIKTMVDAQDPANAEGNKKLYAACDLAMGVMASKVRCESQGCIHTRLLGRVREGDVLCGS